MKKTKVIMKTALVLALLAGLVSFHQITPWIIAPIDYKPILAEWEIEFSEENRLTISDENIKNFLNSYGVYPDLDFERVTRDDGSIYYVGVMSDEMADFLQKLVDGYNNYNSYHGNTEVAQLDMVDARLALTGGLQQTYDNARNEVDDPIVDFLYWCSQPADLVHRPQDLVENEPLS